VASSDSTKEYTHRINKYRDSVNRFYNIMSAIVLFKFSNSSLTKLFEKIDGFSFLYSYFYALYSRPQNVIFSDIITYICSILCAI